MNDEIMMTRKKTQDFDNDSSSSSTLSSENDGTPSIFEGMEKSIFLLCTSNVIIIVKTCTIFINWFIAQNAPLAEKDVETNKMKLLSRALF